MTRSSFVLLIKLAFTVTIASSFQYHTLPSLLTFRRTTTHPTTRQQQAFVEEMDSVTLVLDNFFKTQPFLAAFVACSVKASAADFLAQSSVEDTPEFKDIHDLASQQSTQQTTRNVLQVLEHLNVQRNVAFLLYGGLYQGMFLQFLYLVVYPLLYDGSDFRIPLSILSDICAFGPFVTLPIAYIIRGMLESPDALDETSQGSWMEPIYQAVDKYKSHVLTQNLLLKYWMVWAPAQTINWCLVPEHLRVFFVAFVSFFWVYSLSTISSQQTEKNRNWTDSSQVHTKPRQSTTS